MLLFPHRIPNVLHLTDFGLVPVDSLCSPVYSRDGDGRSWVRKVPAEPGELLAEALGWLLSRDLGVPTPDSAIHVTHVETSWLSEVVGPMDHWSPVCAQRLADPDELAKIIALDAIIGNFDRHEGNILARPDDTIEQLRLFSIDLGWSWIGESDLGSRGVDVPGDYDPPGIRGLIEGVPVDVIRDAAAACANDALHLDQRLIGEYVQEACQIAGQPARKLKLQQALVYRCRNAPSIVQAHLDSIERRA
jgi:hypothetical protein